MLEILLLALAAAILYHLGWGVFFFLQPLQIIFVRRGERAFLAGLSIAALGIVGFRLGGSAIQEAWKGMEPFLLVEIFVLFTLLAGLSAVNLLRVSSSGGVVGHLPVLLAATIASGLLSIPLILAVSRNEAFSAGITQIFGALAEQMRRMAQESGALVSPRALNPEALMSLSREFFFRSYLFNYFALLAFSWYFGTLLGYRTLKREPKVRRISAFRLEDEYVWILIASLALILLDALHPLGIAGYAAWNAALILIALYALEGIGVLRFLLVKFRVPRGIQWLAAAALISLGFTSRIAMAFLLAVPALGVSEIWINYRKQERSNSTL